MAQKACVNTGAPGTFITVVTADVPQQLPKSLTVAVAASGSLFTSCERPTWLCGAHNVPVLFQP